MLFAASVCNEKMERADYSIAELFLIIELTMSLV